MFPRRLAASIATAGAVTALRALSGTASICCDTSQPPAQVLKQAVTHNKDQVLFAPAGGVHCPSVGWFRDFADAQSMLDATFNGDNILQQGNVNWPELDVPATSSAWSMATTPRTTSTTRRSSSDAKRRAGPSPSGGVPPRAARRRARPSPGRRAP